jgi:hypothetical protein
LLLILKIPGIRRIPGISRAELAAAARKIKNNTRTPKETGYIKPAAYGNATMATEQLLLRLPDNLVRRFKQIVPARERSAFVRQLLEQVLPSADSDSDPLYLAALAVEQDKTLRLATKWRSGKPALSETV